MEGKLETKCVCSVTWGMWALLLLCHTPLPSDALGLASYGFVTRDLGAAICCPLGRHVYGTKCELPSHVQLLTSVSDKTLFTARKTWVIPLVGDWEWDRNKLHQDCLQCLLWRLQGLPRWTCPSLSVTIRTMVRNRACEQPEERQVSKSASPGLRKYFKNFQTPIILKGQQSSPDCSASVNMKTFAFLRSQAAQETNKIKIMF